MPWPVYVEADLFLRGRGLSTRATAFGRELAEGELTLVDLDAPKLNRCLALLERYEDMGLDLPDAAVISVAIDADAEILTWDFRHFRAVVTSRGRGLPLLVSESQMPTP